MDANGYNRDISRSEQKTKEFEKNVRANLSKAAGAFTALAGAVGAGVSVFETFNKAINSNQELADKAANAINAMKSTVDSFFYSMTTGDFSAFIGGLDDVIQRATEASAALDQLSNTQMSFGYFSAENQAALQEYSTLAKDKNADPAKVEAARKAAEEALRSQAEIVEVYSKDSQAAIKSMVGAAAGVDASFLEMADIEKSFYLDVSRNREGQKEVLDRQYQEYQRLYNESVNRNTVTSGYSTNYGTFQSSTTNWEAVGREMSKILPMYKDAVIYNATLNKWTDEQLQSAMNIGAAYKNANRELDSMRKSFNKIDQADVTTPKATPKTTQKTVYEAGSIGYLDEQINALNQKLKAATDDATRAGIQDAINGLESQKLALNMSLSPGSLEQINQQISYLQKQFTNATDDATRIGIQKAINELNKQKQRITLIAEFTAGLEVSKAIPGTELKLPKIKNIEPIVKQSDIQLNNDFADSLNAIGSVLGVVTNMTDEGAAAWLSWSANLMSAIAQALPQIQTLIAAKTAEGAVSAGASAAQTPLIGWLLAGGAIAAFLAAAASVPKFAEGGIVGGSSFIGDKNLARLNSGEMVLTRFQQTKLFDMLDNGGVGPGGQVEFKIRGQELYGVLSNYNNKRSKVR